MIRHGSGRQLFVLREGDSMAQKIDISGILKKHKAWHKKFATKNRVYEGNRVNNYINKVAGVEQKGLFRQHYFPGLNYKRV